MITVKTIRKAGVLFLIIILTLPCMAGCVNKADTFKRRRETAMQYYSQSDYVFDYYDAYDSSADEIFITREQALSDYDEMWGILDENYPFFGVAERKFGVDRYEVEFYYRHVIERYEPMSLVLFHYIIEDCLYEFNGIGHLNTIYPEEYPFFCSIYAEDEEGYFSTINDELNNETVKEMYGQLLPNGEEMVSEYIESIEEGTTENLIFEQIDDKTAYMKILSFEAFFVDHDYPLIIDYYKQIARYENLIIDLTENGGGSGRYWTDALIAPNISEEEYAISWSLAKEGALNKKYFETQDVFPFSVPKSINSNKPLIERDDYRELDYAFSWTSWVEPGEDAGFEGNIYVLTSDMVYSASESFVMFCKQTGFATLVGTPTGGDGAGVDPLLAHLTNSGLLFRFSPLYTLNPDGTNNEEYGTEPDFWCKEGETPLDACLRAIEEGFIIEYDYRYGKESSYVLNGA